MKRWIAVSLLATALGSGSLQARQGALSGTLIVNVRIVDGTGAPARAGAVRIARGVITCAGACRAQRGDTSVDGKGLVLAPGFIDSHSHHDEGLEDDRQAGVVVRQGVTTIVVGQDGFSAVPLAPFFARYEARPAAVNIASYVGHNSIREAVMGKDAKRAARPAEIVRMQALTAQAVRAGALGLSSGLEYKSGLYSTKAEVLALARTAANGGGRYISHIRSEDVHLDEAIEEVLTIGRVTGMPVQISHLKVAMLDRWGDAPKILRRLDAARAEGVKVTADVYPYAWWHSSLDVTLPNRDFNDRAAAEFSLKHSAPADGLVLSDFPPDPSLVGKSVADVARMRGISPAEALLALNREAAAMGKGSGVMGHSMADDDVAAMLGWKHSVICSDGALAGRHPRGAGSFPKVFAWLVRGTGALSLEEAVHKMTGQTAANLGIRNRGVIATGKAADLVLFDPAVIADRSTFADPLAAPVGIVRVWVNGTEVLSGGQPNGRTPGQVIRRGR